ncbi:MAG: NAD(P)H-dependent glycerol-3-phosphate dehydrogenase [Pseudomonadota bacterium]|jgi:glycerol-3-phosphate dehydrogenase (NAD(P)+)|nr:MAG: glycerol-3-phosphate dehydrogenase [Pseudomonadota bacterium]
MTKGVLQVGVIGAGAWGTALALVAARAGHRVTLWARGAETSREINVTRENKARLPGITLPEEISATSTPEDLAACELVMIATPAQAMREVMGGFRPHLQPGTSAVITAKGIEQGTSQFLADVLRETCPALEPMILSGPSFAGDVARQLPTAVTLAARSLELARPVAEALSSPTFRPYISDDLVGVQIGGAVKNVLAIACGIVTGHGLGESARAALIARAFAELSRFGTALGARRETLTGLSGLGDLVLTCSSAQSRNFRLGLALGQGQSVEAATASAGGVTEGAYTAEAVVSIADSRGIDVPVSAAVHAILQGRLSIPQAVSALMQRPLKAED